MSAAVRRVRRRRRSDPLFRKRPKKKPAEKWDGPDDILIWEEFYNTVVRDPVTAAAFLSPLLFEDEKAALHKHTQEWLTKHIEKWPEHKEFLQTLAAEQTKLSIITNRHVDDEKASKLARAASGDHFQLYNLAVGYHRGINGYAADMNKAIFYYKEAAKRGNTWSLYNLGKIYMEGLRGIGRNEALGLGYLVKGAADACCQTKLGEYYETVDKDLATEWYEKAIAQGNHTAKFRLAFMLKESNRPRAIGLFRDFLSHERNLAEDEAPEFLPSLATDTNDWDPYIRFAQRLIEE